MPCSFCTSVSAQIFCFLVLFYCIYFWLLFLQTPVPIILGLFFLSLGLFDLEGLSLLGLFSMRPVSLFLGMSTLFSVWWGIYLYRVGFDSSHLLSVLFSIYSPPPFTPHQGVSPSSRFTRHLLPTEDFFLRFPTCMVDDHLSLSFLLYISHGCLFPIFMCARSHLLYCM